MLGPICAFFLTFGMQTPLAEAAPFSGLPLHGEEAEAFLENATIQSIEKLESKALTRPRKVKLSDGEKTHFAVFKTIDDYDPKKEFADGQFEFQFSDSYKYEIAAYQLDKLLGLGIVPPVVERRIKGENGSLSLWVEGAMTEWERLMVKKIHPPDVAAWNHQMFTIRLFLQLIYDTDFKNINNLLVTPNWKVYSIDASRAFRNHKELRREESLQKFSRPFLEGLRGLTQEQLTTNLREWLSKRQIEALWFRRDLILELADRRIAEDGEEKVLYD